MKFSTVSAIAAASGALAAYDNDTLVTFTSVISTVVTEYTTYCPEPTTLTHGNKTITITTAGTVTITDCPCTITTTVPCTTTYPPETKPVPVVPTTSCPPAESSVPPAESSVPPAESSVPPAESSVPPAKSSVPPVPTANGANQASIAGGVAGLIAIGAYLL